jgi:Na+/proline symporter
MSSLDSALNALSSTAYVDIYRKYIRRDGDERHAVMVSRLFVLVFAGVLALVAVYCSKTASILWLGFRVFGYTYGGLLGIFLLAVLTKRRGSDWGNVAALLSSIAVVVFLTAHSVGALSPMRALLLGVFGVDAFAWPWAIVIGMVWSFAVGALFRTRTEVRIQEPEVRIKQ